MLSKRPTFLPLALSLIAAALCAPLQAAELGEVKVNSHLGQQLSADIELVDLTPADLADLQARLASPDVFKGANLTMPPVLGGLYISVARRDNRRFLHLTTLQPVHAEALHLFLELNSGGRQIIRAASLWLTPEPPAQRIARSAAMPAAAPVPTPAPAPAPVSAPAVASPAAPTSGEAGLSEAAQRAFEHRKRLAMAQAAAAPAPAPAPAASATPAPAAATTAPSAPATAAPQATAPDAARPAVASRAARRAITTAEPPRGAAGAPKPAAAPAAPAPTCAPAQQVEAQLQQCQAMNTKLVDIEGRVQRLQVAMTTTSAAGAAGAIVPASPPKPSVAPAKPGAAPSKPGAAAVKPGVAAELAGKSSNRLLMIGAGVLSGLAVLGGFIYFLRKRKDKGPLKIWQSFRKKGTTEAKEPTLETQAEVTTQE
jgi:pilus assembly protein FimV